MSDLISRQAAIDAVNIAYTKTEIVNNRSVNDYERELYFRTRGELSKLPSAQPAQQWIPVSERLPEEYGNYLISIHGEDDPDIGTINPNDKRGWSLCDANGFHWASDKKLIVTAWMPLPEPYREDGETT